MPISGIVVSVGIASGVALTIHAEDPPLDVKLLPIGQIENEKVRLKHAFEILIKYLQHCQQHLCPTCDNFQLIDADIMLLEDESLIDDLCQHINQYRVSAAVAINRLFSEQANDLASMDDPYLANRSNDVLCLSKRLNSALHGHLQWGLSSLQQDTILLAEDLTPAEFAILPLEHITGIVLKSGGFTSHTAILARSAGIPTLLDCQFSHVPIADNTPLLLDAIQGELHVNPDEATILALLEKKRQEDLRRQALLRYKDKPSQTQDGHSVSLLANVGNLNDIIHVTDMGAQGIGLFRTEFMLMNAKALPNEQQQYQLYCDALHQLNGQLLTIRTFDIGADKDIPFLHQPKEDNPALGVRGIRYSLTHPDTFISQVKAILRAANHGPIRLMFPMVSQIEELERALNLLEIAKQQLIEQDKSIGNIQLGIVVETPAAVLNLASMLPHLDFISIGTNDLTQYTLAADRANPTLVNNYPSLSPAVLQLISMTIEMCKKHNVSVSLCGELGSDPKILPLLVGMGIDELSINANNILEVKARLIRGNFSEFVAHADTIKSLKRIKDIYAQIEVFNAN